MKAQKQITFFRLFVIALSFTLFSTSVSYSQTAFNVIGGGSACAGSGGVAVGLANSQLGVVYQLKRNGSSVGLPVVGTGLAINFGNQTIAGTYTIEATHLTTLLTNLMTGSANVIINALPVVSISSTSLCLGGALSIGGTGTSEQIIWKKGSATIDTVEGGWEENGTTIGQDQASPGNIFVASSGDLYVADWNNDRILKFANGYNSTTAGVVVAGGNGYGSDPNQLAFPSSVFVDAAGYIYVSDYDNNRIQRFPPNSTSDSVGTTVAADGINGAATVKLDDSGYIYVADNGNGRVLKFPPNSDENTTGTEVVSGYSSMWRIELDADGNIYTIDFDSLAIRKFPDGSIVAGGNGDGSGLNQISGPGGMVVDANGNLFVLDQNNSRVLRFPSGSASATNGTVVAGIGGYGDGPSQINFPQGIALDANSNLYVSDVGNSRIQKYLLNTNYTPTTSGQYWAIIVDANGCSANTDTITIESAPSLYTVTGGGSFCSGGSGVPVGLSGSETGVNYQLTRNNVDVGSPVAGTGSALSFGNQTVSGLYKVVGTTSTSGCINNMAGGAAVASGLTPDVSITTDNICPGRVLRFSNNNQAWVSKILWTKNGIGVDSAFAFLDSAATSVATGNQPTSIFVDNDTIYVQSWNDGYIRKWAPGASLGTIVGGNNAVNFSGGMAIDASGNIYVTDVLHHAVKKWTSTSTFGAIVAGGNGDGSNANQLSNPTGLFIDAAGVLYIVDAGNNRIQRWLPNATSGSTVAGGNGNGSAANQLSDPLAVFVDVNGSVYVADGGNNRIQKWAFNASSGTTVAGGNGNGSGANQLSGPAGLFVDLGANLYIADKGNNRIQRWLKNGITGTTIAGGHGAGSAASQLNSPVGISIIKNNIYVVDQNNNRIQKFTTNIDSTFNTGAGNGIFRAIATSATGCTSTSDSIAVNQKPTASIAKTNILCRGNATGALNLTINGGTTPYSFNWSNSATTEDISNLVAGPYSVTMTDAQGCVVTSRDTIFQPATALKDSSWHTNVTCAGNNGTVSLNVSGGTPPYTYNWSNGATTKNLVGVGAGTYRVTITDANGCQKTDSQVVTSTTVTLNTSFSKTNVTCFGGNNGSINLSVSGGTAPYNFTWSNGATTQNLTGVVAGTYKVAISDANGCVRNDSVIITSPLPIITTLVKTNITCAGSTDGKIILTVNNGVAPFTYSWSTGATTKDIVNLGAGTYSVTVTDANGCTNTNSQTINSPSPITTSAIITNVTCFGYSDGEIDLSVIGGTAPFTFSWNNGSTTEDLSNLSAGNYSVTVTDSKGCPSASASVTVNQSPTSLTYATTPANINCSGNNSGTITISGVSGGTAPYTYSIDAGSYSSAISFSGLAEGLHTINVKDSFGCIVSKNTGVMKSFCAVAKNDSFLNCANTSLTFTLAQLIANDSIPAGDSVSITDWGTPSIGTVTYDNVAKTLTYTPPPGYAGPASFTYTIKKNDGTFFNPINNHFYEYRLTTGTTWATAKAAASASVKNGMQGYLATITSAAENAFVFAKLQGDGWTGGSDIANEGTWRWVTGPEGLENGGAGRIFSNQTRSGVCVFGVTGTGVSGQYVNWDQGEPNDCGAPFPTTFSPTDINRFGEHYSYCFGSLGGTWNDLNGLIPINGYIIEYGGLEPVQTPTITSTATINITNLLVSPSATTTNVSCNGGNNGTIIVSATGGTSPYQYSKDNGTNYQGSNAFSGLTAATYPVKVKDANGCLSIVGATVSQPALLIATETHTNVSCFGGSNGSISLTVTGGIAPYTYSWSNAATTQNINTLTAGSYTATVGDANNCTAAITTTISQPAVLTTSETHNNPSCFGGNNGSINLTTIGGTAPYSYNWSNSAITEDITGLTSGSYNVNITDVNSCTATRTITIGQPSQITIVGTISFSSHNNGNIDITVAGGTAPYTYSWDNNATIEDLHNLPDGTYNVTVTDAAGCIKVASFSVISPAAMAVDGIIQNVSCNGGSDGSIQIILTGGLAPYSFLWGNGSAVRDRTNLIAGTYSVLITDAFGDTISHSWTVTQPIALATSASITNATIFGNNNGSISLSVSGGTPPYTYQWNDNNTSQNRSSIVAGTYTVTVKDTKGCTLISSYTVTQPAQLIITGITTNVSIFGGSNGTITTTTAGGVGPYSYSWTGSSITTANRTGLAAGTYIVTVTDANGATSAGTFTIIQPPLLTVTGIKTNVTAFNEDDGSINITPTGGVGPYTYLWSNSEITEDVDSLVAGTYSVVVTDANGATASATFIITQPAQLVITGVTINVTTYGGSNGAITTTTTGGVGPYTYVWHNSTVTTANRTGLVAGTYTVVVTDANGATATRSFTITQPTQTIFPVTSACTFPYVITLESITLVNGKYEWVWSIRNPNPGNGKNGTVQDLSHWDIKLGTCALFENITGGATSTNGISWTSFTPTYQVDPSIGNTGNVIKFNVSTSGTSKVYCKLITTQNLTINLQSVAYYKSGSKTGSGTLCFPGFGCTTGGKGSDEEEDTNVLASAEISDISVYPNPNNGYFKVEIPSISSNGMVIVRDMTGKIVTSMNVNASEISQNVQIDLSSQPKGIYIVEVACNNAHYISRVSIQ